MKFLPLIWAGIWRKKGRAILTLLSVLNAFVLFGLLEGFSSGVGKAIQETRADMLISFNKVSILEGLPLGHMAQMKTVKGVQAISPIVIFTSTVRTPSNFVQALAVDPETFFQAAPTVVASPQALQAMHTNRMGALAGADLLRLQRWKIGDVVPLRSLYWPNRNGQPNWPVTIVGTYRPLDTSFGANQLFVNYNYVDDGRMSQQGTANLFIMHIADPNRASEISNAIDALFANSAHETKTATQKQYAQNQLKQIGDIGFVIRAIMGAVFFALLLSVGAVMMQSVRERTPELAVLKTLGFSDSGVLAIVLSETILFCVFSAGLGLLVAAALFPAIKGVIGFTMQAGPVLAFGLVAAVVLALLTGLPPAIRAMRLQIVDALANR